MISHMNAFVAMYVKKIATTPRKLICGPLVEVDHNPWNEI